MENVSLYKKTYQMTAAEWQEFILRQQEKFTETIKQLRKRNFERNLPFLILSEDLPDGHAYSEYADGHIEIKELYKVGDETELRFIRTLSDTEAEKVREDLDLENRSRYKKCY